MTNHRSTIGFLRPRSEGTVIETMACLTNPVVAIQYLLRRDSSAW